MDTISFVCAPRADQAGPEPVRIGLAIDGKELKRFDVTASAGKYQDIQLKQSLRAGQRRFGVVFLNDYYKPDDPDPKQRDRNLIVESIEIEGPLYSPGDRSGLPSQDHLQNSQNEADAPATARLILEKFASRAYRRPVTPGEVAKLVTLVTWRCRTATVSSAGSSSRFRRLCCRRNSSSASSSIHARKRCHQALRDPPAGHAIGDFELASRLSYFLWSSMPDDDLWRVAVSGSLRSPEVLEKQVRRMLRDPKSEALVDNFAGQWLQLRNLRAMNPDRATYPNFDEAFARP